MRLTRQLPSTVGCVYCVQARTSWCVTRATSWRTPTQPCPRPWARSRRGAAWCSPELLSRTTWLSVSVCVLGPRQVWLGVEGEVCVCVYMCVCVCAVGKFFRDVLGLCFKKRKEEESKEVVLLLHYAFQDYRYISIGVFTFTADEYCKILLAFCEQYRRLVCLCCYLGGSVGEQLVWLIFSSDIQ